MSEFEQSWPVSGDIHDHQRYYDMGRKIYSQDVIEPTDGKFAISYGLTVQGGPETFHVLRGDASTGKTRFLNLVYGEGRRVEIAEQDTENTLFGYEVAGVKTDGKVRATNSDPNFFLNEISQIENPAPLGVLGNGTEIRTIRGELSLENASVAASDNLWAPGQVRVKRRDSAMDSRFRNSFLIGGVEATKAQEIHAIAARKSNYSSETEGLLRNVGGLIPNLAAKIALKQALSANLPANEREVGVFMTNLLDSVMTNPLLHKGSLQLAAARLTEGAIPAARAHKLMEGTATSYEQIGRKQLARVASLSVSNVISLNPIGVEMVSDELGIIDRLDSYTSEVAVRRLVAGLAQKISFEMDDEVIPENMLRKNIQKYSYASTGNADTDEIIDELVVREILYPQAAVEEQTYERPRRGFFRKTR